jgi:hypothetical protein
MRALGGSLLCYLESMASGAAVETGSNSGPDLVEMQPEDDASISREKMEVVANRKKGNFKDSMMFGDLEIFGNKLKVVKVSHGGIGNRRKGLRLTPC